MAPPVLNAAEVDALLRSSENRTTMYQGKGHDPEGRGHSLARHYLITNLGLVERRDTEPRNGKIAYFSAYITRTDMVEAARELLNSPAGFWAREQLFDVAATPARPRGSHTGMRAVIHFTGRTFRVRYAGATEIMPVSCCRMMLDRVDERPLKLHVHTFYPALAGDRPGWAVVCYRDGRQFATWP